MVEKASDSRLIALRDRFGLLAPEEAWSVLQRLTWLATTPEAVKLMNQAVDDVLSKEERPAKTETRIELIGAPPDLPPGKYDGVIVGVNETTEDDIGVLTLRYQFVDPSECTGANDGTCPKHPDVCI